MPDEGENHTVPPTGVQYSDPPKDINALIVKLPTFWSSSPSTGFIQAEAQFALGRITPDMSEHNYVGATLPQDVVNEVVDGQVASGSQCGSYYSEGSGRGEFN